jgi:hypothetical protein
VGVSNNYMNGAQLNDSMTFVGATFLSLGITPGTYVYSWSNNGNADSLTLQIGPATVPDTGTTGSLLGLSLMGLAFLRRKIPA